MKFEQPSNLNTENQEPSPHLNTEATVVPGESNGHDIKLSGVNRFILPPRSQHHKESIERGFIEKSVSADIAEVEKIMPKELKECIEQINTLLISFLREWGLKEAVNITPENIVLTDIHRSSKEKSNSQSAAGEYHYNANRIKILTEWKSGNFRAFVKTLIHEMIHMQAFQSWDVDGGNHLRRRRQGVRARSKLDILGNKDSFAWLDEAITETLAKRFLEIHESDIKILKDWRKPLVFVEKVKQDFKKSDFYDGYSYF